MTKSISRRTAFYKHLRQKAHRDKVLFREALCVTDIPPGPKVLYQWANEQCWTPCRTGGKWSNNAFLSGSQIDDIELFVRDEDVDFLDTQVAHHHRTDMVVSLLDIARPAKRKGVAKDFEVVPKIRNVIALEDEFEGLWEDDEWERIHDEHNAERRKSYSSVLKGNNT